MKYKIYLIICLINNKIYIGRTKKRILKRFNEHITTAMSNAPSRIRYYIHNAIRKHGAENFLITQIDETELFAESKIKETFWIKHYQSYLQEYGYNLVAESRNGFEFVSKSTRNKLSVNTHKNKTQYKTKYGYGIDGSNVGRNERDLYTAYIEKDRKRYRKCFHCLLDAQKAYDKVALAIYGDDAVLNHPELKEEYLQEDLKTFYKWFTKDKEFKSGYRGVGKSTDNTWRVCVNFNGKCYYLGIYVNKKEAALDRDIVYFYLVKNTKRLNFPDKIIEMSDTEIETRAKYLIENAKNEKPETTEFFGVTLCLKTNKYKSSLVKGHHRLNLGYFENKLDAAETYDKVHYYLFQDKIKLNFPDKINLFTTEELENFYKKTRGITRIAKNNFIGVAKARKTKKIKFRGIAFLSQGKTLPVGIFNNELEAAIERDKIQYFLTKNPSQLNFPEKIVEFDLVQIEKDYLKIIERIKKDPNTTSKYIGVSKRRDTGKWDVGVKIKGFPRFRKNFQNEEDAARAYDIEMIKRKGVNVITNFPIGNYKDLFPELFT